MGDSYSSGEGNPPFDAGTALERDHNTDKCHRSPLAWPRTLGGSPDLHIACSGAVIADLLYGSGYIAPDDHSQYERLLAAQAASPVSLVTITIGGNDLGFPDILSTCFTNDCTPQLNVASEYLPALKKQLVEVYKTIREDAPSARIVVVGYPRLFPRGVAVNCGWLTHAEKTAATALAADLDTAIADAVAEANAQHVDATYVSVLDALQGHELCTTSPWVYRLSAASVGTTNYQYQGHPTGNGQKAIAAQVAAHLAALTTSPIPPPSGPSQYAGHIVQWNGDSKSQKTAWYVTPDLKRLWIPDVATYNCLKARGAPGPDPLPASVLNQLPDQNARWAPCGDTMAQSRSLRRGMNLTSNSGRFSLQLQSDGNLVEYAEPCQQPLWSNNRFNTSYLWMQTDGNLVGYTDRNQPTWSTNTAGSRGDHLVVQDDGNVVLYAGSRPLWWTNTVQPGSDGCQGAPPAPVGPPIPPRVGTTTEQSGTFGSPTFTDPVHASGKGQTIPPMSYVQVSCKVKPATTIASAYPDGYWYRIASAPWDDQYYAVANTFWNGDIPGHRPYTHNTDFSIPDCGGPSNTTPPPPTTTPPPPVSGSTRTETEGRSGVNTFSNYHNASGMGPRINPLQTVDVSCKVLDGTIASVNPDGYWYRIASSPWSNGYYAPANTFLNGDPIQGPYANNTDFAVPDCGAPTTTPATLPSSPATTTTSTPPSTTTPTTRPLGPASGSIAFISGRTGSDQLFTINPDGSSVTEVTAGNPVTAPAWLGKTGGLVFIRRPSSSLPMGDLTVRSPAGQERVLPTNGAASFPSSSPDGQRIVFVRTTTADPEGGLFVINVDGSGLQQLVKTACFNSQPAWSPDGTKIAFWSSRDDCGSGNYDLYVMNADGSGQTRLTNAPPSNGAASWAPDSQRIAFESTRDGNREIYVMNVDGAGVLRLTNNPASDGNPSWSPDGGTIAFESDRSGNVDIYEMNPDGSNVRRITSDSADDKQPRWGIPPSVGDPQTTTTTTTTPTTGTPSTTATSPGGTTTTTRCYVVYPTPDFPNPTTLPPVGSPTTTEALTTTVAPTTTTTRIDCTSRPPQRQG